MELQIFKNEQFGEVQLVEINNEPWFIGKEIAEILGYKNSRDALSKHVDEEDKGVAKRDTLGGSQDQVIINESGLYSLILKSKLPQAKQFKRWVTSEVLPAIRKHGGYLTDNKLEEALL
ncbi:BRO-N domain-containing protein, partial [Streptococcus suis]